MKVIVDHDLCEANALCMASTQEVFLVNEDDTLTILMPEFPDRLLPQVKEAVRLCPRQALKIEG